ncbi:MAG TPA: hypothetical protein VIP77_06535 [Jiangellaceae bacterium]
MTEPKPTRFLSARLREYAEGWGQMFRDLVEHPALDNDVPEEETAALDWVPYGLDERDKWSSIDHGKTAHWWVGASGTACGKDFIRDIRHAEFDAPKCRKCTAALAKEAD